jgi:hypothetical protein
MSNFKVALDAVLAFVEGPKSLLGILCHPHDDGAQLCQGLVSGLERSFGPV